MKAKIGKRVEWVVDDVRADNVKEQEARKRDFGTGHLRLGTSTPCLKPTSSTRPQSRVGQIELQTDSALSLNGGRQCRVGARGRRTVPQYFAVTADSHRSEENAPPPNFLFIRQDNKHNRYDEDGPSSVPAWTRIRITSTTRIFAYSRTCTGGNARVSDWKGVLPYQVAKAGAKVVTVLPCSSFGEDELEILADTEETGYIL